MAVAVAVGVAAKSGAVPSLVFQAGSSSRDQDTGATPTRMLRKSSCDELMFGSGSPGLSDGEAKKIDENIKGPMARIWTIMIIST